MFGSTRIVEEPLKKIIKIPKHKILGISCYHYFILGRYIDIAESSKPMYFYRFLLLIYARRIKRWFSKK